MQFLCSDFPTQIMEISTAFVMYFLVSRCIPDTQPDGVPAGAPQSAASNRRSHDFAAQLLHKTEGRNQTQRIHHGLCHKKMQKVYPLFISVLIRF